MSINLPEFTQFVQPMNWQNNLFEFVWKIAQSISKRITCRKLWLSLYCFHHNTIFCDCKKFHFLVKWSCHRSNYTQNLEPSFLNCLYNINSRFCTKVSHAPINQLPTAHWGEFSRPYEIANKFWTSLLLRACYILYSHSYIFRIRNLSKPGLLIETWFSWF